MQTLNGRFLPLLFLIYAGCGDDDAGGGTPDAPAAACPTGTGPTMHPAGNLTGVETWSAEASPHVVEGTIYLRDGGQLTIEPCAEVLLAEGASLLVGQPSPTTGELIALGTSDRPIRFAGRDGARWGGVELVTPGKVRLASIIMEGGGGGTADGASLAAVGALTTPAAADLSVDNVTVRGSLGAGVSMRSAARFADGSVQLVVEGSGGGADPYPVRLNPHAIDSLPEGRYSGNARDEILLVDEGVNGSRGLQADATMRNRGAPYHVRTVDMTGLRVGAAQPGATQVTLTIEAGVTLKFEPQGALEMVTFNADEAAQGVLRAIGTEAAPIVFTSAADAPAPGDWRGLYFAGQIAAENALDHVRIEYAGAECLCGYPTCSDLTGHEAAVILSAPPPSAFITNSTIASSALHAVLRGYEYTTSTHDFRTTNTFTANAGCDQTLPVRTGDACPDPRPACE